MTLSYEVHDLDRPGDSWRRLSGSDARDTFFAVEVRGSRHRDRCEASMLSVKWMPKGRAEYCFSGRRHRVEGDTLLLSAPHNLYDVELAKGMHSDSFCLFVPHPVAADLWTAAVHSVAAQIDDPAARLAPEFPEVSTAGWRDVVRQVSTIRSSLRSAAPAEDRTGMVLLECMLRMHRLSRAAEGATAVKPATRAELLRRLLRARDYIDANPAARPTLAELAREARLSRYHFLRTFVEVFGETPGNYVARMRIARSAELLTRTHKPMTDIAAEAGFASQSAFARSFRRWRGISPLAYRKTVRN